MAQFIINNNILASIKLLLFFATKGFYLKMSFDIIKIFNVNTYE